MIDPNEKPKQPKAAKPRLAMLLPFTALLLALGVNLAIREQHARTPLRPEIAPAESKPGVGVGKNFGATKDGKEDKAAEGRLADSLLTDSILSIVQSYYVDPERVDNKSLVSTALAALATNPRVKTGMADTSVWIEVDGKKKTLPLHDGMRYQEVLDVFSEIGRVVDESSLNVAVGEAPEKDASGTVVLLNSMLAELDAHSALLSPDAYKELRQGTEGAFGGLGVLVGIRENLLTVIKPLPRSPAQHAGIKKHDRILSIDGVDTYGYTLDELVEYMRGDPGTEVKLSLLRDGAPSPSEMNLKREVIHVDSVQVEEMERDGVPILHLTIENFASRTSREVLNAIKHFRDKHNGKMPGLVLDLRSNPGGLLDQAVQVADLFLESGVIVTTKGRREEVETAGSGIDEGGFPIAVLIDGDSASASEIVAGALQDHGRAVVIGQPSFGKGSVQTIFELPGERALKLTIARYYTPAGRSIQNVGIIPDVWLQPVAKADTNDNLFGPYRYKNERFLHSHLELSAEGVERRDQANRHLPVRKAYYLTDAAADEDDKKKQDIEMDLALGMIKKIRTTYGDGPLPEGTGRASHWLALAGPLVGQYADRLDRDASKWIASRFKVDWSREGGDSGQSKNAGVEASASADVRLELDQAGQIGATPGQNVKVKYHLKNNGSRREDRLSVYVRSDTLGFDTREVLAGTVDKGGTKDGTLEIPIPPAAEPGPLLLHLGVASDAWPARAAGQDLLLQINARPVAELKADVTMATESGHPDGILESSEHAKLRVSLLNDGAIAARDLTVRVINLSGSQVTIDKNPRTIAVVPQGGEKDIFVDIEGGKTLFTPEIQIGLLVESGDLRLPVRQRFVLKALPNSTNVKIQKVGTNLTKPMSH